MKTLLVTGGIGSGKSEVCRYLAAKGWPVYDCDSRAKGLYDSRPDLLEKIENALGGGLVREDGTLDRAKLASKVFGDEKALAVLDSIVHPAVQEDLEAWLETVRSEGYDLAVVESAIAAKVPSLPALSDRICLVSAPVQTRVDRICRRSGLSASQAMARVQSQAGLDTLEHDFEITNDNNNLDQLRFSVDRVLEQVLKKD